MLISPSTTVYAFWMADILMALLAYTPLTFSTCEMDIGLPHSPDYKLSDAYCPLLQDTFSTVEITSPDDALVLLMGLLSDVIYLQRSLGPMRASAANQFNPYVPLSPHTEFSRLRNTLRQALNQWIGAFQDTPPAVKAFYHLCRLHLSQPDIASLVNEVGYLQPAKRLSFAGVTVADEAVEHAWLILDTVAARSNGRDIDESVSSPWLPMSVFHAALVVWARQQWGNAYGSNRILLPFVVELSHMPWPCCERMCSTLNSLMEVNRS